MEYSCFENAIAKSHDLEELFKEYRYEDLVIAFFCVLIKRNNRSAQENCFSINQALLEHADKKCGLKRISIYDDFVQFFSKVKKLLPITCYDDYIVPDFGEIKVVFDGKAYKTFIGTGHPQSYACLTYLNAIAKISKKHEFFKQILEFYDELISFFECENPLKESSKNERKIEFELPSEELFVRTKDFFYSYNFEKHIKIYDYIKKFTVIEQQHFLRYSGKLLPMFNTSLVIDVITDVVTTTPHALESAVELGLENFMNSANNLANDYRTCFFAFPVRICSNNKPIPGTTINFVIRTSKGIICCIERKLWEQEKKNFKALFTKSPEKNIVLVENRKRFSSNGYVSMNVVNPEQSVRFIVYEPFLDINSLSPLPQFNDPELNTVSMSSLDLIILLEFSDNVNDIWDFYCFYSEKNNIGIMSMAGLAGVFLTWKNNEKYIEKGVLHSNFINIDYNYVIDYVWNYYIEKLNNYPWKHVTKTIFEYPNFWLINTNNSNFYLYNSKFTNFGGRVAQLGKITVFLSTNGFFFQKLPPKEQHWEMETIFVIVEDILFRGLKSIEDILKHFDITKSVFIHLLFEPSAYYDSNERNSTQLKYINLNSFLNEGYIHIKFKIYDELLLKDINLANDRSIESEFLQEIFLPIKKIDPRLYEKINVELNSIASEKKQVGVYPVEISYLWNNVAPIYNVSNESYHWARKRISKIIDRHGIDCGEYRGKQANEIIRKIQKDLIPDFESLIIDFNQYDLQINLESIYSRVIHEISISSIEYSNISDVDTKIKNELYQTIITNREKLKHQKGVLEYLMESNLFCYRERDKIVSNNDLEKLLAYANWLFVLANNADFSYLSDSDLHIIISREKIIDVEYDYIDNKYEFLAKRIYDDNGYEPKGDDEDKKFYAHAVDCFATDTGVNYFLLLEFLNFLSLDISCCEHNELLPNVFQVNIEKIKNSFLSCCCNSNYSEKELNAVVDFITIKPSLLKTCENKSDYYLPIGKRKLRDNRIELKCLWDHMGTVVYSPVMTHFSKEYWDIGFKDFFLPYTSGLNNTQKALTQWKKRYEKQIVFDVKSIFRSCGFSSVFHNFDPRKIDQKDRKLQRLGDYDVIAIDTVQHKIWIVECKMLSKVGSIHDMYMQQKNFFQEHKEDEHFQLRIDYMNNNYHTILKFLNCDSRDDYSVESIMVMNKVMISRYKNVDFKILAISELENYVMQNK